MRKLKTKELQPEYRPDEKFLAYGPKALSDAELLAIILRTGSTDYHSVDLARKILTPEGDDHTSILNIFHYEFPELLKIKGVGKVKAIQIQAIAEISLRIAQSQARTHLVFNNPEKVALYYMEQLRHARQETIILLMLDSACHLIREQTISTGTVDMALASPREIFICALKHEAVRIILLHNHPSGNPTPSRADLKMTEDIDRIGGIIGIRLLDHIIIGDNSYFSFKESENLHE
ncbi:MAG: DNA repair protein RadC [Parasporobacterium sp.]|nr:DNA repair protein RadC [Parasporobacterium sp.]